MKKRVLIVISHYLPGYKAGGPIQTIKNIIEVFGKEYLFHILTLNHDMGSSATYPGITDGWNRVGNANVLYVPDAHFNMKTIVNISNDMDIVYACSFFAIQTVETMIAKRMNRIKCPVIVAPMGVFSKGAFEQKRFKKECCLLLLKVIGAQKCIGWSFSSEIEKADAKRCLGEIGNYVICEDLPRKIEPWAYELVKDKSDTHVGMPAKRPYKKAGELRVVFLSRICPKKNLLGALEILNCPWDGQITFDIYGTEEDCNYWQKCKNEISRMHDSVSVNYCGTVSSDEVLQVFAKYDVFLFPTLGENYGHVVFEAMSVGCVPIISNTTIWNNLREKGCGYIFALNDINGFRDAIRACIAADRIVWDRLSVNALRYAVDKYDTAIKNSGYPLLLDM